MIELEKNIELASNIYWRGIEAKDTNEDVNKLADELIATKVVKYFGAFARDVKGAPVEKLAKAVADSKNARYIYEFAEDVENAPIEVLADGLMKCSESDAKWLRWFAHEFEGAPKEKLMARYKELDVPVQ